MSNDTLVWCDTETTGLNKVTDHLLEVAVVLTDLDGDVLDSIQRVILPTERSVMRELITTMQVAPPGTGASIVWNMHSKSGLWEEVVINGYAYEDVDKALSEFLEYNEAPIDNLGNMPMCGNSVNFDLDMVSGRLPLFRSHFSHRVIDISSTKELVKGRHPGVAAEWQEICDTKGNKPHRAMEDILWSIEEYKFYLEQGVIA